MFNPQRLLGALCEAEVAFVVIGGVAAVAQGSSYVTGDLDICYQRHPANYTRICSALRVFQPRLRGVPADLPFRFDEATFKRGLNFTLVTDVGDIDLLGEVAGLGDYEAVNTSAQEMELFGQRVRVLTLEGLILSKQAAGRTKDLLLLPELQALQALRSEEQDCSSE